MKTSIAAGTVLFATVCLPPAAAAADRHHVRPSPTRPPAGSANMQYYGGPVIAQTQVVNVLWGTKVDPNVVMGAEGFYQALITSNYMDCLGEYDTAGATVTMGSGGGTGTSQHINRGTSVQTVTISPTTLTGTMMLSDVDTELTTEINAGHLPMPAKDPDGTIDTIFMVALPPGLNLNDGGGTSCAKSNGWCASHYTLSFSGMNIPFAILPDYSTGGCATTCGAAQSSATGFDAFTFNASHEFVEAVTDPDDPPLAWYDNGGNQEIADACDSETTIGMIGAYQVEEFWSRRLNKCISGDPSLPPCSAGTRPCTPESDGGASSSSSGSSTSSGGSSSGSTSGGTSGSSSSGSGSSSGSIGSNGSSGSSSSGGGNGSSGATGSSNGGSGSGAGGVDGGGGDGGSGAGFVPSGESAGCGCVSVGTDPSSDTALFAAGAFALGSLVRRRGRPGRA
jgi:MYXO-CTERM domain-containing protein